MEPDSPPNPRSCLPADSLDPADSAGIGFAQTDARPNEREFTRESGGVLWEMMELARKGERLGVTYGIGSDLRLKPVSPNLRQQFTYERRPVKFPAAYETALRVPVPV